MIRDNQQPNDRLQRLEEDWDQLTDEQLLDYEWETDRPQSLANVQEEIPTDLPQCRIELEYRLPLGEWVRCAHCPRHQKHRHGYVLKAEDGRRFLLGSFCGPEAFGADYRIESAARARAKRRAKALLRWRDTAQKLPDFIAALGDAERSVERRAIRRMRGSFRLRAPRAISLLQAIQPHHLTGELRLSVSRRRRDTDAEAKRDQSYQAAMLSIADLPTKAHRQRLAELKSEHRPGEPIYVDEFQDFGLLRGHIWLLADQDPANELTAVIARLRAIVAVMGTTQDKTTVYLERLPNDLRHELNTAAAVINVINEAARFLAPDSLGRLCDWLRCQAEEVAMIGETLKLEEGGNAAVELALPAGWMPPGLLFFELRSGS